MNYNLYRLVEMILLLYKMLYLEQCKLLKMMMLQNTSTKDKVFVLMKEVLLVKEVLTTDETY